MPGPYSRNSPRATTTAWPPTKTRSSSPSRASARAKSVEGRPISTPCEISIHPPHSTRPCRQRWTTSGPAAEPVAGSSGTPFDGANILVFQAVPEPAKQLTMTPSSVSAEKSGRNAATSSREPSVTNVCRTPLSYRSTGSWDPSTSQRLQESVWLRVRLDAGQRLAHPAEDDLPAPFAFELDRHDAALRLQLDHSPLERGRQHPGGAQTRMPGERKLGLGREDADPDGAALLRRQHEGRLGEPDLERKRLHGLLVDLPRVGEDGELVSLERPVGEDVGDDVAQAGHGATLLRTRRPAGRDYARRDAPLPRSPRAFRPG